MALVVAGCSNTVGEPSSPDTSASSASQSGAAPRVPAALDVSSIQSNACAAISDSKRSSLGYGAGKPRAGAYGPSCTFQIADEPLNQMDLTVFTANKNGLSDIYDTKGNNDYFEPTTIEGYPAVYAASLDHRSKGKCGLFVAVTDQLTVNLLSQFDRGAGAQAPCPVVAKAAASVIQTLKGD
ncbi:DUF3558 domain-containing protein [Allokutzneria multivorans]|uniref:DUF3558 domain-containing protein n=1 Tax=Allokutzneria multivorans TaxID=1142134 RepID=A0ABP7R7P7_9PSEU